MSRCDDVSFEALADVAESAYQGLGQAMRDVAALGVPWSVSLHEFVTRSPMSYMAWAVGERHEYRQSM